MTCFVDSSAFYAAMDTDDRNHPQAARQWATLLAEPAVLVTTSYILVETLALLQHRLGLAAVQAFHEDVYPLLRPEWVQARAHEAAMAGVLGARRRDLSLVDCVSFEVMRSLGVRRVFAFDPHFAEQGFDCLPGGG
jgi:predicted nucleic acid-binding protein